MARASSSFTAKLDTFMDAYVQAAYDTLNDLEACAGIRNNPDLSYKARANHYGHHTPNGGYAPPRVWVDAATRNTDAAEKIAQVIKSRIVAARARFDGQVSAGYTETVHHVEREVMTRGYSPSRPFDAAYTRNGPRDIMQAIANTMAENQKQLILSWGVTPENAESTIRRKGADKPPLVWTGAMVKGIKGWVQSTTERVEAEVEIRNKK